MSREFVGVIGALALAYLLVSGVRWVVSRLIIRRSADWATALAPQRWRMWIAWAVMVASVVVLGSMESAGNGATLPGQ